MNTHDALYRRLYEKYGESMAGHEVMHEMGITNSRALKRISPQTLPRMGGGRQGVRVTYRTTDVANYILAYPPRKPHGNTVAIDARAFIRLSAQHGLTHKEKGELIDAWLASLMYGDESANLDLQQITALTPCSRQNLTRLAERGIPLNPLESGVFGIAA